MTRVPLTLRRRASGFTLVELMVAIVIGLVVCIAAVTAMMTFAASQRRDVGEDANVENAAVFLFSMSHEIKNSGVSPVDFANALVCTSFNLSSTDGTLLDGQAVYPVTITDGGAAGSDQITIAYGNSILGKSGTQLTADMSSPTADLLVASAVGFNKGDIIAVGIPSGVTGAGAPCTVMQVSAVAVGGTTADLAHVGMTYNNGAVFTTAPTYPAGSMVFGVGGFSRVVYQVGGTGLQITNNLVTPAQQNVIADNVVFMKAQYGVVTAAGQPLQWVSAGNAPWNALTAALAQQIRAIHVGVLMRNSQKIQPTNAARTCDATTGAAATVTLWAGGPSVSLSAALAGGNPDWACYKYRAFDLVVPLKNVMFQ